MLKKLQEHYHFKGGSYYHWRIFVEILNRFIAIIVVPSSIYTHASLNILLLPTIQYYNYDIILKIECIQLSKK